MDSVAVFLAIDFAWYKNIVHGIPDLIAMARCGSYGSESGTWSLNMQLIYIYILPLRISGLSVGSMMICCLFAYQLAFCLVKHVGSVTNRLDIMFAFKGLDSTFRPNPTQDGRMCLWYHWQRYLVLRAPYPHPFVGWWPPLGVLGDWCNWKKLKESLRIPVWVSNTHPFLTC